MQALFELAQECQVMPQAQALFRGEPLNVTEHRAALHMALRAQPSAAAPWGPSISLAVQEQLKRFLAFAEQVRAGAWTGHDGTPLTHVVNIGIGGSDLGPRMAAQALTSQGHGRGTRVQVHHVSNIDPVAMENLLATLPPRETGFIVQSKSFTTQETVSLSQTARHWLQAGGCPPQGLASHWVAVTAHPDLALAQGFLPEQTFVFWDWVGGRYSVWSAIGLPLAIAIGAEAFHAFLAGARAMDGHFLQAPPEHNLPLILALLGVWNGNFLGSNSLNVAPYAYGLSQFVPYLQQLEMESNGKRTHVDGSAVQVQTAPVVWGGLGADAQHAYFQLLHQGPQSVPVDFIGVRQTPCSGPHAQQQHQITLDNLRAQSRALALGRNEPDTRAALQAEGWSEAKVQALWAHRTYPGNRPSSTIWLEQLDPASLGALMALYEHKVFCQSVLWGINPFDQWGVELGKTLASQMARPSGSS
jgi:glucose-6-phosphate isomerase